MAWLIPYCDLTLAQQQFVDASCAESQLIVGGPGSGKTVVLAHKLKRLTDQGKHVHLFTYTKSVEEYIASDVKPLGVAGHVSTLDSWAKEWFKDNISATLPRDGRRINFDEIIESVTADLRETYYEHILVDEGQDLDDRRVLLLKRMADSFTIAADDKQLLFTDGTQLQQLRNQLGLATVSLLETYRCCEYISSVAARFLTASHAREFLAQTQGVYDNARQVKWKDTQDEDAEFSAMVEAIQDSQNQGDLTIAILAPTRRLGQRFHELLEREGIDCSQYDPRPWMPSLDLDRPVIITYHSAKGLTFDSVFLPGLRRRGFGQFNTDADKMRTIFVGVTRATSSAWLGGPCTVSDSVRAAVDEGVAAGDIFRY